MAYSQTQIVDMAQNSRDLNGFREFKLQPNEGRVSCSRGKKEELVVLGKKKSMDLNFCLINASEPTVFNEINLIEIIKE